MTNLYDLLSLEEKKNLKILSLEKNVILFREDDLCEYIGVVLEGEMIISSISYKGNELIYIHLYPGDVFGGNLIFSKDKKYRGNVSSIMNSKVVLISEKQLIHLLSNNEEFLKKYLELQSDFGKKANAQVKLLSFTDAEERFIYYLKLNNNFLFIKNVTDLSKNLFLSRETVSRLISKLIKNNVIIKKGNIIKKE